MPGKKSKHTKKWDSCFDKVKKDKGESAAAAICSSSIKNAGLKSQHQKRDKKDYYSNIKKEKAKKESMITDFNNFNENTDVSEIIRFMAGLLSSSAPDASPNTKYYNGYTKNTFNTSTDSGIGGYLPSGTTNTTLIDLCKYLIYNSYCFCCILYDCYAPFKSKCVKM